LIAAKQLAQTRMTQIRMSTSGIAGFFKFLFRHSCYLELKNEKFYLETFVREINQAEERIQREINRIPPPLSYQAAPPLVSPLPLQVVPPTPAPHPTFPINASLPLSQAPPPAPPQPPALLPRNRFSPAPPSFSSVPPPPLPGFNPVPSIQLLPDEPAPLSFKPAEYKKKGIKNLTKAEVEAQVAEVREYIAELKLALTPLDNYITEFDRLNLEIQGNAEHLGAKTAVSNAERNLEKIDARKNGLKRAAEEGFLIKLQKKIGNKLISYPIFPDENWENINAARRRSRLTLLPEVLKLSCALKAHDSKEAAEQELLTAQQQLSQLTADLQHLETLKPIDRPHKALVTLLAAKKKMLQEWERGLNNRERHLQTGFREISLNASREALQMGSDDDTGLEELGELNSTELATLSRIQPADFYDGMFLELDS
jgi:hypothetical protein